MSAAVRRPWDLLLVPAATLLFHVATSRGYGHHRDELYYLVNGEHLGWGYVEHPPLIGWVAALVRGTLGDSVAAIRFPAAVAAALVVLLVGLTARDLGRQPGTAVEGAVGGGPFARVLAMLAAALAPIYVSLFGFLSMNAFDLLWWALAGWLLVRLLGAGRDRGGDPRLWLAFGAVAGLGLLTKLSFLFLGLGVAAGLLLARRWDVLRSPWLWAGGVLAALMFLPHVLWQVEHGWPTLEFMDNARRLKNVELPVAGFLAEQLRMTAPSGLLLAVPGVLWLLLARQARPWRAAGWVFPVVLVAMLVLGGAKPYYLAPAYLLPLAAGGRAWEAWTERWRTGGRRAAEGVDRQQGPGQERRGGRRFVLRRRAVVAGAVRVAVPTGVLLLGVVLAPLAKAILPVESYVRYAARLGVEPGTDERQEVGRLPQFFADMHGWPELARTVAEVYRALPAEEREVACVFASNYGEAGALDVFGRPLGLPPAISSHNSYFLWGSRGCSGEVMLIVARDRGDLDELFAEVTPGAVFRCTDCMPYENGRTVWIARRLRVPIEQAWPAVKEYI